MEAGRLAYLMACLSFAESGGLFPPFRLLFREDSAGSPPGWQAL